MRPIRLYLDSSDYSVLSDPKRRTPDLFNLLSQLRAWIEEGKVQCVFSGTHLSEMAPLNGAIDAAERRADLLSDLCGQNALVSQDVLFTKEFRVALGQQNVGVTAYSGRGDWFPGGSLDVLPLEDVSIAGEIHLAVDKMQLNRKEKRKAKRFALRDGKPRRSVQEMLKKNARIASLEEILAVYPMRPQDARILGRYVVGDVTKEEANEAFLNSLRDPRWMMQWFRQHHVKMTAFTEWIRDPAKTITDNFLKISQEIALVRSNDKLLGRKTADVTSNQWTLWQDDLLVSVSHKLAAALLGEPSVSFTAEDIDQSCPGLSTGIRALHSAWWSAMVATPRKPKLSDFPDALHAMYAPYVDVFRADSFMAPYIKRYSARYGTQVVPKLTLLKSTIDTLMSSSRADVQ